MQTGLKRMQRLIDSLLAYARSGKPELEVEDVDLAAVVDRVRSGLAAALAERTARLDVDVAAAPQVRADPRLLELVMQNLLSNALKFASAEPVVRITSRPERRGVCVAVSDNGLGIDTETQAKIFQPFARGAPAASVAGTGIGLAICQRIIERAGGKVG